MLRPEPASAALPGTSATISPGTAEPQFAKRAGGQRPAERLLAAFHSFETFPALRRSRDAMLRAAADPNAGDGELGHVVETDPALAVAILRAASRLTPGKKPVDVPTAAATLSPAEIEAAVADVAVFDFFDQSRMWSGTVEQFRVHARATQAATEYVRRALELGPRPDLLVMALLHDVGKLVMLHAYERYDAIWNARGTADDRLALERAEIGFDHALAGGVLVRRLGLSDRLARAIEHHHSDGARDDAAIIRLADMLAHYATGDPVDPGALSAAAQAVSLSPDQLRAALDELPGGANQGARSSTPSPLSPRETQMIQKLAEGKLYKQIADEFGLAPSTVRSHLNHSYKKLGVMDRAQAVLLATSRGWL
jgi:DNA-binding CsgD family transcriptional regulator/HD-like signal output (HDOD) protein